MDETHRFEIMLAWPADTNQPRPPDTGYSRNSVLTSPGKMAIAASSPAKFGGDDSRYNPEELLTASLAQCHMLTFLAIAAKKRIAVLRYEDHASATLGAGPSGKWQILEVVLRPRVTLAPGSTPADFQAMHDKAHANCFMANSVNFSVLVEARIVDEK